ncbi:MAG: hypothetical protein HC911_15395, partial [Chloroflexaceae bacterium]|nr:hypothetical protein [Chloroflexaceae bacterium]
MSDNSSGNTFNQQGQNVGRDQYNIGGDAHIHPPSPTADPALMASREQQYRTALADELDQFELFGLPRMKDVVLYQKLSNAYITLSV